MKKTDMEARIRSLEDLVARLVLTLNDKTRPEKCYVNEWHVHPDWERMKAEAHSLLEDKSWKPE